jgi:hypothetical protein
MNGFEGALELSIQIIMSLMHFALAGLVLWLIVGGLKDATLSAMLRKAGEDVRPNGGAS